MIISLYLFLAACAKDASSEVGTAPNHNDTDFWGPDTGTGTINVPIFMSDDNVCQVDFTAGIDGLLTRTTETYIVTNSKLYGDAIESIINAKLEFTRCYIVTDSEGNIAREPKECTESFLGCIYDVPEDMK